MNLGLGLNFKRNFKIIRREGCPDTYMSMNIMHPNAHPYAVSSAGALILARATCSDQLPTRLSHAGINQLTSETVTDRQSHALICIYRQIPSLWR